MNLKENCTQEEIRKSFREDCRVISLKYEYSNYIGEERYALVSDLSETELWEKYPEIVKSYVPFVLLTTEQGQVIAEYERNEDKFKKRQKREKDILSFACDEKERLHAKLIEEDFVAELERDEIWRSECKVLKEAFELLTTVQKRRIIQYCIHGKTLRAIAQEEGIYYSMVDKSVRAGLKKMKRYFEVVM